MEVILGVGIWVVIFIVWYVRNYPEKFRGIIPTLNVMSKLRRKTKTVNARPVSNPGVQKDYRALVETVESICARDRIGSSDAASMVQAAQKLMEIEPSSGQIWEAYALDSLESALITCDDCRVPVEKTVKKTGVRISCPKCGKWLALKNSKVTVIDPNRPDLEDWEN
jgi:predicted RNA-binding Zn-ribbon protein involved in translation (DUF1610 family)